MFRVHNNSIPIMKIPYVALVSGYRRSQFLKPIVRAFELGTNRQESWPKSNSNPNKCYPVRWPERLEVPNSFGATVEIWRRDGKPDRATIYGDHPLPRRTYLVTDPFHQRSNRRYVVKIFDRCPGVLVFTPHPRAV